MAERAYTDALAALNALLDKHEARPGRTGSLFVRAAHPRDFPGVDAVDRFDRHLQGAAEEGAVEIRRTPKAGRHGPIEKIKLTDPEILYRRLGRKPARQTVGTAFSHFCETTDLRHVDGAVLQQIREAWSIKKGWRRLEANDYDALHRIIQLHQALEARLQGDALDMRTFSRRACGDSKAMETLKTPLAAFIIAHRPDLAVYKDADDLFRTLGVEKMPQPILLAGPVRVTGLDVGAELPYVGLPPQALDAIDLAHLCVAVRRVLTVENFASFTLQVTQHGNPETLVIYTGGFPSRALAGLLATLGATLPAAVRFHHWGDIDMRGAEIAHFIWSTLGRTLELHLMSPSLARECGVAADPRPMPSIGPESPAYELARFLSGDMGDAFTLEQEELDSSIP